jgi:DNA-binding CsgD family transcriptional regulator
MSRFAEPEVGSAAGARGDLLTVLERGEPPAFATDDRHRIVFWNKGAERLLGRAAKEALGYRCHEVMGGRDAFGNRFCYENCPLMATIRRGEPVSGCELTLPVNGNLRTLAVTTLEVPAALDGGFTLVHIVRPAREASHPARSDRGAGNGSADAAPPPLTGREREILEWVAAGLQNKEVAQRLDISLATVRNHIHNMLEKLGVHSKLEAVSLAFRSGWIEGPPATVKPPGC